eukprot:SAG31_NODE_1036_length_10221_cov_170.602326_8_plen_164_part_00
MAVVLPPFGRDRYPVAAPLVAFLCDLLLPKTRLEVTKRLLIEADRLVRHNLLQCGSPAPVLWELTTWLEAELPRILELVMPMAELFEDLVSATSLTCTQPALNFCFKRNVSALCATVVYCSFHAATSSAAHASDKDVLDVLICCYGVRHFNQSQSQSQLSHQN